MDDQTFELLLDGIKDDITEIKTDVKEGFKGINGRVRGAEVKSARHDERIKDLEDRPSPTKMILGLGAFLSLLTTILKYVG